MYSRRTDRGQSAFTLIEVLVSVVLISIVVLGIVKIREQYTEAAHYLNDRMQEALTNSLFLTRDIIPYSGKEKNAYDLLRGMHIAKDRTREILRAQKRQIRVSDPLPIGELPIAVELREIFLKGKYAAHYYRLNL